MKLQSVGTKMSAENAAKLRIVASRNQSNTSEFIRKTMERIIESELKRAPLTTKESKFWKEHRE